MSIWSLIGRNGRDEADLRGTNYRRVRAYGTFQDALGRVGTFEGTYTLQGFVEQYGQLAAVGVVAGRLCAVDGTELGMTGRRVTLAVSATAIDGCVLAEIGPVDVNLAGMMAHIEPLTLHLLPNPMWSGLCDVLLDAIRPCLTRPAASERLVSLLNALLSILDPPDSATQR